LQPGTSHVKDVQRMRPIDKEKLLEYALNYDISYEV